MNDTAHRNDVAIDQRTPDWTEILSRTVDDLSQIARTEMELLNTRLKMLLEVETDKITGLACLLVALSYGSLFLLGGIVLLMHLWLAWWLSFMITGLAIVTAGVVFQAILSKKARNKEVGT
jgi:hypothetical protein